MTEVAKTEIDTELKVEVAPRVTIVRKALKRDTQKIHPDLVEAYKALSEQLADLADETRAVPGWIADGELKKVQVYMDKLTFLSGHMKNCGTITRSISQG